jgi:hypothetical protein
MFELFSRVPETLREITNIYSLDMKEAVAEVYGTQTGSKIHYLLTH